MKRLMNKWVIGIFVIIIVIGGVIMTQRKTPFDIFLTKDYTKPTQDELVTYLKKYEQEMTKGVIGWNSKIKSVQWQWGTTNVEQIGNGTPQGGGWVLTIDGKINEIKDSNFQIGFELETKKSFPNMNNFYQMQQFTIDGGSKPYE